jgi:predicted SAM-dependent methyltransferase
MNENITMIKGVIEKVSMNSLPFTRQNLQTLGLKGFHCGSGTNLHPGWLNSDSMTIGDQNNNTSVFGEVVMIDRVKYYLEYDQTKPLPIEDETFDYVLSEHFIEHINLHDAVKWLEEIRRILKKGGFLRLSTPDLYIYACGYLINQNNFFEQHSQNLLQMGMKQVPQRKAWMMNQIFRWWGHQWIYDFDEIKTVAITAGFQEQDIRKCQFHQGSIPEVAQLDLIDRKDESIYVEIYKSYTG